MATKPAKLSKGLTLLVDTLQKKLLNTKVGLLPKKIMIQETPHQ